MSRARIRGLCCDPGSGGPPFPPSLQGWGASKISPGTRGERGASRSPLGTRSPHGSALSGERTRSRQIRAPNSCEFEAPRGAGCLCGLARPLGAETDVDCGGGAPCKACNKGKDCKVDTDCVTGACVSGTCNLPTSCKQLKNGLLNVPSGVYQLDVDGDGPKLPFEAYCEMLVDGGGWILVGRSRNTPSNPGCAGTDGGTNFGWRSAQGSLGDDVNAYSMDVVSKGIVFTQVLFGNHIGSKQFDGTIYRQTVINDFVNVHQATHYYIGEPTTVQGACANGAVMFSWMGFTSNTDSFHFRDVDGNGFGLTASGWRSCYDTCVGGNLNGRPGLIFVR